MAELCRDLAARGYLCVSINYRLRSPDGIPEAGVALRNAVDDAAQAVRWLASHAQEWRLDTRRIGIGGSSAGATIALRLAYDSPPPAIPIAAVLSWSGALYAPAERRCGTTPMRAPVACPR